MEKLDSKKKEAFKQFKYAIKDCKLSEYYNNDQALLNWFAARNYNVDLAEKMLRNHMEWERLNRVDDILETFTPPEVLNKYYSIGNFGLDKYGSLVYISIQGRLDMKGMLQCVTRKDFMRYQIWLSEAFKWDIRRENEKNPNKNTLLTYIMDMDQLSIAQAAYKPGLEARIEAFKLIEYHYSENCRRTFVINAPKVITIIFNMMKGFLNQTTVDKVRIFGTDRKEWQAALLEEIEADQLPEIFGGTLRNPKEGDPTGPTGLYKFNYAGPIPVEYYLTRTAPEPKDYMETFNIIAGPGGKKKISLKVENINSIYRWEFMTEGGDLAYRVYRKDPEEGIVDLVPHGRVESNLCMEEGQIFCDSIGKYVLEFDNTYSFVKMKKIRYFVTVDPPSTSFIA